MEEIVQEPIDGAGVISPFSPCLEPCALYQRFNGPAGIDLRRDTAKQIVHLRRVVTAATRERRVPDLIAVHGGSLAARPIHLPGDRPVMSRSVTLTDTAGCLVLDRVPGAVCLGACPLSPGAAGKRAVCDPGLADGWIEVAWSPPAEAGTARADLDAALDAFLSRRGLSRADLAGENIRIDLVYLGPSVGGCGRRLMIRTTALPPGG